MGLLNLSHTVGFYPQEDWPGIVADWVNRLSHPPELPGTFEEARNHLRIRLSPDGSQPGWAAYRPVCDGLDQTLVLRVEVGAITVSEEQLSKWGVEPDEAWKEALDHTIWDEPRDRTYLVKDGMTIHWLRESFFASSALLGMDHLLSRGNRFGAVVMAPVRDALLYTEILDESFIASSAGMIETGGRWYVEDPGPISADLFWYRPGGQGLSRLVKQVGRGFEPCWGRDFSSVLAELSSDLATIDRDRARRSKSRRTRGGFTVPG